MLGVALWSLIPSCIIATEACVYVGTEYLYISGGYKARTGKIGNSACHLSGC